MNSTDDKIDSLHAPSTDPPANPPPSDNSTSPQATDPDLAPLTSPAFHALIGLPPPISNPQPAFPPKSSRTDHGLYHTINRAYTYTNAKYRIFDIATYVLLALQLLLSAVFIILGSLANIDSHIAIAVLGAISTVIGGALALMKGQGLPNRLRQSRDRLADVRFEAEELYWDFNAGRRVTFADVRKLRERFVGVLQDERRQHPDAWNPSVEQVLAALRGPRGEQFPGRMAESGILAAGPTVKDVEALGKVG